MFDIFSMFSVLYQLESKLKCQVMFLGWCFKHFLLLLTLYGNTRCLVQIHGSVGIVRMLIIDSISSLISPILGGSGSQGTHLVCARIFLFQACYKITVICFFFYIFFLGLCGLMWMCPMALVTCFELLDEYQDVP